ncbi:DUF6924 domain-containing protein [Actinacidiphila paucisporea]|uniref:DUF6924 domain-containing protein n=1 Tax=Actinacidiphila paucisporea TaxID=310782 RepID=UPI00389910C5
MVHHQLRHDARPLEDRRLTCGFAAERTQGNPCSPHTVPKVTDVTFRTVPAEIHGIHANLSIANLTFEEFGHGLTTIPRRFNGPSEQGSRNRRRRSRCGDSVGEP